MNGEWLSGDALSPTRRLGQVRVVSSLLRSSPPRRRYRREGGGLQVPQTERENVPPQGREVIKIPGAIN